MADRRRQLLLVAVVLISVLESLPVESHEPEVPDRIMTMLGPEGEAILTTGLRLQVGDRFIDAGNDFWTVQKVEGATAFARRLARLTGRPSEAEVAALRRAWHPRAEAIPAQTGGHAPADVVLYHSHSDESYIPTDGTHSINGKGGIYRVGERFSQALQEQGLTVVHRQENHNPRDHGAYHRSRRTALDSLTLYTPQIMFDIHRDASPAGEYMRSVAGQRVAQVMIVIGQTNPAHDANLTFARLLKDEADQRFPGLVKGIFVGRGNYNQDIYTRNLLLEAGSHEVSREAAEAGIALLASAVPPLLLETAAPETEEAAAEEQAAWSVIWQLLWAVPLASLLWLVLTAGGIRPALAKLQRWWDQIGNRR